MQSTLHINGLKYYAYHGLHDFEKKIGGRFEVNLSMNTVMPINGYTDELIQVIDYSDVEKVVSAIMLVSVDLIETLAFKILQALMNQFPLIQGIKVEVIKWAPPIEKECTSTSIVLKQNYLE
jgi:dihydroneopterin aldolase